MNRSGVVLQSATVGRCSAKILQNEVALDRYLPTAPQPIPKSLHAINTAITLVDNVLGPDVLIVVVLLLTCMLAAAMVP